MEECPNQFQPNTSMPQLELLQPDMRSGQGIYCNRKQAIEPLQCKALHRSNGVYKE